MARSGGTLISKCIGCMDGVTLLSEVHPANLKATKPMMQAQKWHKLIGTKDIARWKIRPPNTLQFLSLCETRASARGEALVVRDWSHLDYIGVPYAEPEYGFALGQVLEAAYDIRFVNTVRHPIDQYLSLIQLHVVMPKLTIEGYLKGCRAFAEFASEHGFYRYEDFTQDADSILSSMCSDLDLSFDAQYVNKWHQFTKVTGDTVPALGRGSTKKTIESFPRKPVDEALLAAMRANDDYQQTCELLGYEA